MTDTDRIRDALHCIPATDRDTWLRMGMAVKSEIGDAGFDLWDAWSQQADSYDASDSRDVWRSIRANGKVTVGTLFHEAKAHGWRNGTYEKPSPDIETRQRDVAERFSQEEAERRAQQAGAAKQANAIWDKSRSAPDDHAYLLAKDVKAHGLRVRDGKLVVPMRDISNNLHSLQFIDGCGKKRFLHDGSVVGHYCDIGKPDGVLCIAEGYATGASVHEATGHAVAIAFHAGNLLPVAKALRSKFPDIRLILCADDDVSTPGNPGIAKATEAARAVGGLLAVPDFGESRTGDATDFNDLAATCGVDAVRAAIERAKKPSFDNFGSFGSSSSCASAEIQWPDPKPIQAALHPVAPFDPDALLPEALRAWVMDEADRMPCAPDFIAAGAIVAIGSIIGARCAVKPKAKDDWLVIPNLWGGIVALPSAKKSPAIGAALRPLDRLIAEAMETHTLALADYETEKTVFNAQKDAIEARIKLAAKDPKKGNPKTIANELKKHRDEAPNAPILRRLKTNDATVEKLGELLRENPAGLLVLRDELIGLLASWDKDGREGDRAFFMEGWNGSGSFDTDRIGRGSIFVPNLCLSIFGGIQPDKLTEYLEQAAHALANDGMLQRFQVLVYPDHQAWEWRDRFPDRQARNQAFSVFERILGFEPEAWGAAPSDDFSKFPYFRFDEAAQEIFIEWSGELHRTRLPAEDNPIIAQHLAKFDKLFPALALILHIVDCAATGASGPITAGAALRAAAWCEYLETHARRCYGLLADDGLRAAQALADRVRQGKLPDDFTARDVRRNQWRYLTNDESVRAALDWLTDEGWLRAELIDHDGGRGRPTYRHQINPKIQKSAGRPTANTDKNTFSAVLAVLDLGISEKFEGAEYGQLA